MRWIMFAMLAAAAPAQASEDAAVANGVQQGAVQVRYGDLDLAVPAGRAELDRRVARAVNRVCGMAVPSDPVPTLTAECRENALAGANRQIAALGASAKIGAFSVGGRR